MVLMMISRGTQDDESWYSRMFHIIDCLFMVLKMFDLGTQTCLILLIKMFSRGTQDIWIFNHFN